MSGAETMDNKCACWNQDCYDCWRARYGKVGDVDIDGGPCECACHDEFYCDETDNEPAMTIRNTGDALGQVLADALKRSPG
jgi:hypothetical protein